MPAPTDTDTVVSDSTVPPPDTAAATVTDRADTPSAIEVWPPCAPLSASTDRSMVPASAIVNEAPFTVNPEAVPETANTSTSEITASVLVVNVKVPDPDDAPAAIVTSKVSPPEGIE